MSYPQGPTQQPYPYGGMPPKKSTPPWVFILTAGIVVAAVVAVVLIFTLGGGDDPVAGPSSSSSTAPVSTTEPSVAPPSDPTTSDDGGPSVDEIQAGIVTVLDKVDTNDQISDEQTQALASCIAPKMKDELSVETQQNYADGKDVAANATEKDQVTQLLKDCASEVGVSTG